MAFANAEEFYKIQKIMIEKIQEDETLFKKLKAMNLTLCQKITNIDVIVTLEWKEPFAMHLGMTPPGVKVDSTSSNDDDTFNKFYQGKLNMMMAMQKGQIKSEGKVSQTLKFLPLLGPIFKMYIETLKEVGRADLIIP